MGMNIKMHLLTYADVEDPDQPAVQFDQGLHYPISESLDTIKYIFGDLDTQWVCRMITAFCIWSKTPFCLTWSI